jgi:penicillin-binding protein 2
MSKLSGAFLKHANEPYLFRQRVRILSGFVILFATLLFGRLLYLQVRHYSFYAQLAQQNYEGVSLLTPARGLIFDRNGRLLADNKPQTSLIVSLEQVKQLPALIQSLQSTLGIKLDILDVPRTYRRFEPIVLKHRLTEEEIARFELNQYRFPGVKLHTHWSRYYPLGKTFASIIGYIGRANEQDRILNHAMYYSANDKIGKAGIEQFYEAQLRGEKGYRYLEKNVRKRILRTIKQVPPKNGQDLYLTIDAKLQQFVQSSLGKHTGAVVVMDPRNGEILALVNNPSFNPNQLTQSVNVKKPQSQKSDLSNISFYNRAINGTYPPGSIMKPFISMGALNAQLLYPEDTIYDSGRFQLNSAGKIYRNIYHIAWGNTNLRKAIAVSSDIYFYKLSLKLGVKRIAQFLSQFGYGQPTGIDLPGENAGLVPTKEWKEKMFGGEDWYPGDTLNLGIGQGFMLATPLQMAVATSALAMSGQRWIPHIVLGARAATGEVKVMRPTALPPVKGPAITWQFIHDAMQAVVSEGSAHNAFKDVTYSVGAKTGTAQVFSLKPDQAYDPNTIAANLRDHSLFIAFAPLPHPEVALAIVLENSTLPASYVARRILDYYFKCKTNGST